MVFANWGLFERNSRAFCCLVSEVIVFPFISLTIGSNWYSFTVFNLKWKLCSCFGKFVRLVFQNVTLGVKLVGKCQVGSSNVELAPQMSDWLFSFGRTFSDFFRIFFVSANWLISPLISGSECRAVLSSGVLFPRVVQACSLFLERLACLRTLVALE